MSWTPDQSRVHRSLPSMQPGANCGWFTERTRRSRRDAVGVNIWSALCQAAQWGADTHTWLQCITYSGSCLTTCFHLHLFHTPRKAFSLPLTLFSISHGSLLRLKDALLHFSVFKQNASTQCSGLISCFFFFIRLILCFSESGRQVQGRSVWASGHVNIPSSTVPSWSTHIFAGGFPPVCSLHNLRLCFWCLVLLDVQSVTSCSCDSSSTGAFWVAVFTCSVTTGGAPKLYCSVLTMF